MDKITELPTPKNYAPKAGELFERIEALISEYDGEMSTVEAIGVLELIKINLATPS